MDTLELLPGDSAYEAATPQPGNPSITRLSTGDKFSSTEKVFITAIQTNLLQFHNSLAQPAVIQLSFLAGVSVVMDVAPMTVVHSSGNDITVNWISTNPQHQDWIGLFLQGAPNNTYGDYQFIPDGQTMGTFTFAAPATPGTYEFRYLLTNGYTSVATSAPIVVI